MQPLSLGAETQPEGLHNNKKPNKIEKIVVEQHCIAIIPLV